MSSALTAEPPASRDERATPPLWMESLVGLDWLALHLSPVYYGLGVARGDGRAVVLVPGFLSDRVPFVPMEHWLRRTGYRPYHAGFDRNNDCPDLLTSRVAATIDHAYAETGRPVCIVGHSLGGLIARSAAQLRPQRVAQIISLGTPLREGAVHPYLASLAARARQDILSRGGDAVADPNCYTPACRCPFARSAAGGALPTTVRRLSVCTKTDGVVTWQTCIDYNGDNVAVPGTHSGLPFNPHVLSLIGKTLAALSEQPAGTRRCPRPRSRQARRLARQVAA
jgi:pimeloyl-ACP methyl ester carboxylesterase